MDFPERSMMDPGVASFSPAPINLAHGEMARIIAAQINAKKAEAERRKRRKKGKAQKDARRRNR